MDEQNMNTTATESATGGVNISDTPKMTKEEVQQKSDEELLQMIQQAQGHTNDFQNYMNCDFSYPYLTGLIRNRGYENGWYKTSEGSTPAVTPTIIPMKRSEGEVVRRPYSVDKSIADEWNDFNKNVPFKTVTLGYAMKRFMADYRSGKIKFELDI